MKMKRIVGKEEQRKDNEARRVLKVVNWAGGEARQGMRERAMKGRERGKKEEEEAGKKKTLRKEEQKDREEAEPEER